MGVYQGMREAMVAAGVPAEAIAFIHDAKTAQQRDELQEACRAGRINVLIGSTPKMGTGLNVQQRMVALHHVDVPWRPVQQCDIVAVDPDPDDGGAGPRPARSQ